MNCFSVACDRSEGHDALKRDDIRLRRSLARLREISYRSFGPDKKTATEVDVFWELPVGPEPTTRALRVRRSANRATVDSVGRRCFNTVLIREFEVETSTKTAVIILDFRAGIVL